MAISVRAVATGTSANTLTGVCGLPTGTAVGDVTILAYMQTVSADFPGGTLPTFTPPTGWTVLCNANGVLVCWRAFQNGDPTTNITCTSTRTMWFLSLAISYTGLDTTTPIDTSAFNYRWAKSTGVTPLLCRAPSINPTFNGSQLLCIYTEGGSTGRTIALPAGLGAQANTATGPNLRMADKALTDGTPTGNFDATISGVVNELYFGMSIALKASGAAAATLAVARPVVCGFYNDNTNTTSSYALDLTRLNVQDQDMVVFAMSGIDTVSAAPSGYTQRSSQTGALLYTNIWSTGDTKAPSWTFNNTGGTPARAIAVALVRKQGSSPPGALKQDQLANTTQAGTTAITGTTTAQTPASTSELLIVLFGSTTQTSGSWSAVTAGVTDELIALGPGMRFGWILPAASPTSALSATWTIIGSTSVATTAQLIAAGTNAGGGLLLLGVGGLITPTSVAALAGARAIVRNRPTTRRKLVRPW